MAEIKLSNAITDVLRVYGWKESSTAKVPHTFFKPNLIVSIQPTARKTKMFHLAIHQLDKVSGVEVRLLTQSDLHDYLANH